jgi:hypothetical protein
MMKRNCRVAGTDRNDFSVMDIELFKNKATTLMTHSSELLELGVS